MYNEPQEYLRQLVLQHGEKITSDPRRCMAYLKDLCGSYEREIKVLVMTQQEHIVADLQAADLSLPMPVTIARLTQRLVDALALSEEAARWAVESWALALGVEAQRIRAREFSSTLAIAFRIKPWTPPEAPWHDLGATPGAVTLPPEHDVEMLPDVNNDAEIAQLAEEAKAAGLAGAIKSVSLFYADEVTDQGLVHLQALICLEDLNLTHTQISDAGLACLSSFPHLQRLALSLCTITDESMLDLRNLQELCYLSLFGCQRITDVGFAHLREVHSLTELDLGETLIGDSGLKSLRPLRQLTHLNLCNCKHLTRRGLSSLSYFQHLEELDLSGTAITGKGLAELPTFEHITRLALSHTQITDQELPLLRIFPNLVALDLNDTAITAKGLDALKQLPSLRELSIYGTQFKYPDIQEALHFAHVRDLARMNAPTPGEDASSP